MGAAVTIYVMPLAGAPSKWEGCRHLVAPRYQRLSDGEAPETSRLGEFGAGLLLATVLGVREDGQLEIGSEGKPDLASGWAHISISHDDGLAVLAVSDQVIGVDVEEVPVEYGRLQRDALRGVLSDVAIAQVEASENPALAFALAWTHVEAVVKADGRGFAFRVKGGHLPEGWSCSHVVWSGHAISCAAPEPSSRTGVSSGASVPEPDLPDLRVIEVPMARAIDLLEASGDARHRSETL
ncbi:MAG: 4'-phosphopantetheinyl transferase family protein [Tractidigestivibacter sp.]|jgi:hypothetical protein|uniref:4'-phosphopantetheinyl transferase family protein n=1 Tax=Tractidigestivibacter sp. TaxID=2847320 RepID=UPI003D912BAF